MNGLDLLLEVMRRGVQFRIDASRKLRVIDRDNVLTEPEYVLLRGIKHQIRDLLSMELPAEPGLQVCDALDAPEGVAICRRCARGIGEHFWRRVDLGDRDPAANVCPFFTGSHREPESPCRQCGAPFAEHFNSSEGPKRRETA